LTTPELTRRDRDLLDVLTKRLRVVSLEQAARAWWGRAKDPVQLAARRLGQLQAAGHLELEDRMAHLEPAPNEPLATWQRGLPVPGFAAVTRRLQSRFRDPAVATRCVLATTAAGLERAGHGGESPAESELSHDLLLAEVYLRMRAELPTRARSWRGEGVLPKGQGKKVPDAIVRDGRERTAVEACGPSYSPAKLEAFHRYCEEQRLAYELW